MKLLAILAALALTACASPGPPPALSLAGEVTIANDPGGELGAYLKQAYAVRDAGVPVIIDGECLSSCTVILMAGDKVCVTPRAVLGFHSASDGARNNAALHMAYPERINQWLAAHGGLTDRLIKLEGAEAAGLLRRCI